MNKDHSNQKPAQATLAILLALAAVMVVLSVLISRTSYTHYLNQLENVDATQALLLADSALEEGLYQLQIDGSFTGYSATLPEGTIDIAVADLGSSTRQVTVTVNSQGVQRVITAQVTVTNQTNPLSDIASFAGDDVQLVKSSSMLVGNLWTNDNVRLDEDTIVQGNVYAAGAGNTSTTRVLNGGRIEDNPYTAEVEGNLNAIDRIRVTNNGYVYGTATSTISVTTTSGGYVGAGVVDTGMEIESIEVPIFDFDEFKSQAQASGTYYTNANQFLNTLSLNGNVIADDNVHYIAAGTLELSSSETYDITGSIISENDIYIYADNYTQATSNDIPVLASKHNIYILDQNPCDCTATITGAIFAERDVQIKHDQYTGGLTYAVELSGVIWAGDDAYLEDHSRLIVDPGIAQSVMGFNFEDTGTDNIIKILTWQIE